MSLIVILWVFPEIIIISLIEPAGMINYHLNNGKVGDSIHGQYSEREWQRVAGSEGDHASLCYMYNVYAMKHCSSHFH